MSSQFLKVNQLGLSFGGVCALHNISFELNASDMLAIIGPNGAGKSSLFNVLSGFYSPTSGSFNFLEDHFTTQSSRTLSMMNQKGMARTFQNIRLFQSLTVLQNLLVASPTLKTGSVWGKKGLQQSNQTFQNEADQFLELFGLVSKKNELAVNLSYGDQRRLEMARALMTRPQLLLLDEPAAGMNTTEKQELSQLIRHLHSTLNIAILLIEHDMKLVMNLAPRILVLDHGEVLAMGTPDEICKNQKVIHAYLGSDL